VRVSGCGLLELYNYGEQTAAKCWKVELSDYLCKQMGFTESKNMPSMYLNEEKGIKISVHVDDPLVVCDRSKNQKEWFYNKLKEHFRYKEITTLEKGVELDYLSIRLSVDDDNLINLDNDSFVKKVIENEELTGHRRVDIPVTKEALILMAEESSLGRLLDAEGKRIFQKRVGILN
jgi:hypothetical protein